MFRYIKQGSPEREGQVFNVALGLSFGYLKMLGQLRAIGVSALPNLIIEPLDAMAIAQVSIPFPCSNNCKCCLFYYITGVMK